MSKEGRRQQFNKSRNVEMSMVHEQDMICFVEPLNTLSLKGGQMFHHKGKE